MNAPTSEPQTVMTAQVLPGLGIIVVLLLSLVACQSAEPPLDTPTPVSSPMPGATSTLAAPSITLTPVRYKDTVNIDGTSLFIDCLGSGSPTVVLEAGPGESSSTWYFVMPEVARFARACAYDRAGLGRSSPGSKPRTSQQMADELHALLVNAEIGGPYILVAHATSNWITRLFADQHPEAVAGMVLVSPMHEDLLSRAESIYAPYPELWEQFVWDTEHQGEGQSYADWEASAAQVRAAGTLGDMPLVLLARSNHRPSESPVSDEMEALLIELEHKLLELSTNTTYMIAADSGHFIQREQPEAVVDAIRRVFESVND